MDTSVLLIFMAVMFVAAYTLGRGRSLALTSDTGGARALNSLPFYYGMLTALWAAVPAIVLLGSWSIFDDQIIQFVATQQMPEEIRQLGEAERGLVLNQVYSVVDGQFIGEAPDYVLAAAHHITEMESISVWLKSILVMLAMVIGGALVWMRIHPQLKARNQVETAFRYALLGCACLAILTTLGIVLSVLFESLRFFHAVPITEFLFGAEWSPQTAIRKDQVASDGSFGAVPLFLGTLLIAFIALIVAVPTGLMSAIYLAEYAPRKLRGFLKPLLEILAGIPTVVYGFFAALTVAPFIRDLAYSIGLDNYVTVTSESALAAGLVMGVMIIPFISSLSDDVINAVPQSLRDEIGRAHV